MSTHTGALLCHLGSGDFQTVAGLLSWLLSRLGAAVGTLGHGWPGGEPAETTSRTPQPLPLLKRQQFGLAGRPVSPYSPARCWQLPAASPHPSEASRSAGMERIPAGGFFSWQCRTRAFGKSWRCRNLQRCSWGALAAFKTFQGPSAALPCPDHCSAELVPGDALPFRGCGWKSRGFWAPCSHESKAQGSLPMLCFLLRNCGRQQPAQ